MPQHQRSGRHIGPDLSKVIDRNFTPAALAGLIWNHAPQMWSVMEREGIQRASLSPEASADLFAYFYSVRFFDKPGDAGRGKQVFLAKHCGDCHRITTPMVSGAPYGPAARRMKPELVLRYVKGPVVVEVSVEVKEF